MVLHFVRDDVDIMHIIMNIPYFLRHIWYAINDEDHCPSCLGVLLHQVTRQMSAFQYRSKKGPRTMLYYLGLVLIEMSITFVIHKNLVSLTLSVLRQQYKVRTLHATLVMNIREDVSQLLSEEIERRALSSSSFVLMFSSFVSM